MHAGRAPGRPNPTANLSGALSGEDLPLYYQPQHRPAQKRNFLRGRIAGAAVAATATLVTGVSLGAPAQAAGSVWDTVAACESGGNWAISTGNGYYGGLQFSSQTWSAYGGTRYASTANRASKSAQIAIAQRVLAAQGPGAWPVCSRQAGLTRSNGGAATAVPVRALTVSRSTIRTARDVSGSRATGRLAVDGVMGPMTSRAIQRWAGTAADGVFGPISKKALQRKVGATPDGALGPQTIRALQIRIGARPDGARSLNPSTVAKLQVYLNSH